MHTPQQALNLVSGGRVLDVGTGGGNFAVSIENLKDYSEIVGLEWLSRKYNTPAVICK
jgi:tRNA A58 N-methylase Trm61